MYLILKISAAFFKTLHLHFRLSCHFKVFKNLALLGHRQLYNFTKTKNNWPGWLGRKERPERRPGGTRGEEAT